MSETIGSRILRAVLIGGTAIAVLAIAQPAMAYTELGTTGTVGTHKLKDTKDDPGSFCGFRRTSPDAPNQLKHIYVASPYMKAVPGMGLERVAFDFTVQRRIVGPGGAGPWADRYTSPKFKAHTDTTRWAPFDLQEGVKVIVPFKAGSDKSADYRVIVKMFWFKSDGATVLGTATDRADWYYADQGRGVPNYHHFCPDYP